MSCRAEGSVAKRREKSDSRQEKVEIKDAFDHGTKSLGWPNPQSRSPSMNGVGDGTKL